MRVCSICEITDDLIKFRKDRNQCQPCYNELKRVYQNKYYRENHEKVRKTKNLYREKNRKSHNRKERERYRENNFISPLSFRVYP